MTFKIGLNEYEARKMPPRTVFHVLRRLAPLLGPIGPALMLLLDEKLPKDQFLALAAEQIGPLSHALAYIPDDTLDYVLNKCLQYVTRLDSNKWLPTHLPAGVGPAQAKYADIDAGVELRLTAEVVRENAAGFFAALSDGSASSLSSEPAQP